MNMNFLTGLEPINENIVDDWEKEQRDIEIKNNLMHFMPYGSENQTFDTFTVTNDKEKALLDFGKKYAQAVTDNKFKSLVLLGNCGIGKTHLSYSIMRYVMENGINTKVNTYTVNGVENKEVFTWPKVAKYFIMPQLTERYAAAMSFTSKENQVDIVKDATGANLIVLDEVGRGNKYEKDILYQIINTAWNKKIPLVLISNLSNSDFVNLLGNASIDRLKDSVVSFNLDGLESHRGFNF